MAFTRCCHAVRSSTELIRRVVRQCSVHRKGNQEVCSGDGRDGLADSRTSRDVGGGTQGEAWSLDCLEFQSGGIVVNGKKDVDFRREAKLLPLSSSPYMRASSPAASASQVILLTAEVAAFEGFDTARILKSTGPRRGHCAFRVWVRGRCSQ